MTRFRMAVGLIVAGMACALIGGSASASDAGTTGLAQPIPLTWATGAKAQTGARVYAQKADVKDQLSDDEIIEQIIEDSIARYPGPCACPFNRDRAGRSCGRRSAHSRGGGYAPICFESDVTPDMIQKYRGRRAKS